MIRAPLMKSSLRGLLTNLTLNIILRSWLSLNNVVQWTPTLLIFRVINIGFLYNKEEVDGAIYGWIKALSPRINFSPKYLCYKLNHVEGKG